MKKKILIILIAMFFIMPLTTKAQTIREFEAEVARYTKQLQDKENAIAKNDNEIAEIKKKIAAYEAEIAKAEKEIKDLEEEIKKNNKEIEKKSAESKKLMEYYQVSNGENAYLEYAFGATSITDMIYRMSIVEQLTDYNDKLMKELRALIKRNEEKQKTLNNKKKELKDLENKLKDEKQKIELESEKIRESMPSVKQQIAAAKAQIADLKRMGCGANEEKDACVNRYWAARIAASSSGSISGGGISAPSTNGFYRPMIHGYVTQGYGGYGGHMGVDLSSSDKAITIYPIAAGQVSAKFYDGYGALVLKVRHNAGGRIIYSTYAHLRSWYVSVGQIVSPNTPLGQMGSTGWSTGPHLHLEITTCDWKSEGGGCTWYEYQRSTVSPYSYVELPSSWSNR